MSFPEGKQENNNLHASHYSTGLTLIESHGKLQEYRLSFGDEIGGELRVMQCASVVTQSCHNHKVNVSRAVLCRQNESNYRSHRPIVTFRLLYCNPLE